jgi:hypothetical protein
MHSPADIVAQYLKDQNVVTVPGGATPIFISQLPDKPNTAVGAFDGKSKKDGRLMIGKTIFHPKVQLLVRGHDYRATYDLCDQIKQKLELINTVSVTVESDTYTIQSASLTTDIIALGNEEDKNRRHLMSINFRVTLI